MKAIYHSCNTTEYIKNILQMSEILVTIYGNAHLKTRSFKQLPLQYQKCFKFLKLITN